MKETLSLDHFSKMGWSLVFIKNEKIIFKSKAEHIRPLVFCIKKYKKEMNGAIVFDKIIGLAAAILLAHAKVKGVWTPTISRDAKKYLFGKKIKLECRKITKNILNRRGDDLCPMEKMCRNMPNKEFIGKMLG